MPCQCCGLSRWCGDKDTEDQAKDGNHALDKNAGWEPSGGDGCLMRGSSVVLLHGVTFHYKLTTQECRTPDVKQNPFRCFPQDFSE